ncbi:MAG: glycosyltransferase family protein, partial [Gammaproteobacteria bacterium]|nr:glycosyltransferase family protein [Gammaproteobacteria bacterium]
MGDATASLEARFQLELGVHSLNAGRIEAAGKEFARAIALQTDYVDAYNYLGATHGMVKNFYGATSAFRSAVLLSSHNSVTLSNFGMASLELGRYEIAFENFRRAIVLDPFISRAYAGLGLFHARLNAHQKALPFFFRTHQLIPDAPEEIVNLAACLNELGRFQHALQYSARALSNRPGDQRAMNTRALTYRGLSPLEKGVTWANRAITIDEKFFLAINSLAVLLAETARFDEARTAYRKVLCLEPAYAESRANKGLMDLIHGDYPTGWRDYEARWDVASFKSSLSPVMARKRLRPGDPIFGKTVLLHHEQGLGDTLQFSRYVPLVIGSGARVLLYVPTALVRLFRAQKNFGEVIASGSDIANFDCVCPMMSLPFFFGTELESIPGRCGAYLSAPTHDSLRWSARLDAKFGDRLAAGRPPRVGVVWSGGHRPNEPETWAANDRRNISLDLVARSLDLPGIDFVSLQKGDPAESLLKGRETEYWRAGRLFNPASELSDFASTAGVVANLDLVISVDTSTAHLAAAMGKPTWILNRFDTCWRWMTDEQMSPWYSAVRLYRQG